ncbi:hypothetical protein ZWY2020_009029 [Hordeum vulgare]|nr:hypothetical protein ZWY2020_009029 [Hordeum vulgare]
MEIKRAGSAGDEDDMSQVEQVRLTVPVTDDPSLPVWTFRMWTMGFLLCALLSFLNQFFAYRSEPIVISQTFIQEHVLISIFANAGASFGGGNAYAIGIVTIIKAFYKSNISFVTSLLLVITTQVLGYGWAGQMRKYVVEPAHMWWPVSLVQVCLMRYVQAADDAGQVLPNRAHLQLRVVHTVPGYVFPTLTAVSWVCWVFPKSITMQQIESGLNGLGIGAFTLDWSMVVSRWEPAVTLLRHRQRPRIRSSSLLHHAAAIGCSTSTPPKYPLFFNELFDASGQLYNIVNDKFEIDMDAYAKQGRIHLNLFFAVSYGLGFATIAATLSHVTFFYDKKMYQRFRESYKGKMDVHARLMKRYDDIPNWWFYILLAASMAVSMVLCTVFKEEVQLPWWALLVVCVMAFIFTLPVSVITATTNTTPGLNIITEYCWGLIMPGKPIAKVCFKVYGYMSMNQAVSFLTDFKLGHYMKIPPRSMFLVQGLVGPRRIFGPLGYYSALNWFFLFGLAGPVVVWLLARALPRHTGWISLINLPVILGATGMMPPASTLNYTAWGFVGMVFNFFVFRYPGAASSIGGGSRGEYCDLAACPTAKGVMVDGCPVL